MDSKHYFLKSSQGFKGKTIDEMLGMYNFLNVFCVNPVPPLLVFNNHLALSLFGLPKFRNYVTISIIRHKRTGNANLFLKNYCLSQLRLFFP